MNAEEAIKRNLPILLESNFKYYELSELRTLIDEENVDVLTFF